MNFTKKIFRSLILSGVFITLIYFSGCVGSMETESGKLAYRAQNWAEAEEKLTKGLVADPNDDEGWYMLGHAQTKLGKYEAAAKSFARCLAISNKYADNIRYLWGETYNQGVEKYNNALSCMKSKDSACVKKNFTEALNFFLGATKIMPDSLMVYSILGDTYAYLGKADSSYISYQIIFNKTKDPKDAEKVAGSLYDKAVNTFLDGKYEQATKEFENVMKFEKLSKESKIYEASVYYYALANAAVGADIRDKDPNSEAYKDYFNKAKVALEPLYQNLKNKDLELRIVELLVNVYASLGDADKATEYLKKKEALEKNNNNK